MQNNRASLLTSELVNKLFFPFRTIIKVFFMTMKLAYKPQKEFLRVVLLCWESRNESEKIETIPGSEESVGL